MFPPKLETKIRERIDRLHGWRYAKICEVPLQATETMDHLRLPPEHLDYAPAPKGSKWGAHWGTTWFRGHIEIPRACRGKRVYYRHLSFTDKLLWVDGAAFAGMNPWHEEVLLLRSARGGEQYGIHVEAYAGHPIPGVEPHREGTYTHQFCEADPGREPPLPLEASELVVEREHACPLFYEADVLLRTALILPGDSLRRVRILDALNNAMNLVPFEWSDEEELEAAAKAARKVLASVLNGKNSGSTPAVGVAGHAHIDIAWLWPLQESIRKAAKTFATILNLMDDYPDFRFHQSQPFLCDMIEQHYPELLVRIKKRVREGRWEPNGGMWIEADCNVPGGESLVRQFLEGRKKTLELFGYKPDTLWLPDVFGYSAALPQILKLCEIDNFVTSKINWNDTNSFPYDTFWWQGIDGTQVFSHFINTPSEHRGYNADLLPESVQSTWDLVRHKEVQDSTLASVGWGDGGGGPTREMCERAQRMKDLEGCPKTEFVNVSQFLKRLREHEAVRPRWVGELYLELHRGTYTTQARSKRFNRKIELLLRDVEFLSSLALLRGYPYPGEALRTHWRTLLTNQFHDILPGSAIRGVYETAEREYLSIEQQLSELRDETLRNLGQFVLPDTEGEAYLLSNSLSWDRHEVLVLEGASSTAACDLEGHPLLCQVLAGGGLAIEVKAGSLGLTPIALRKKDAAKESPFVHSARALETPHYSLAFDSAGKIMALFDKEAHRELIKPGKRANDLYTAEDVPAFWDAWDIERYHREKLHFEDRLTSREVLDDGLLLFTLRSTYDIGKRSTLQQDMIFYSTSRRIDFRTRVNWRERHTLLKVGFGLDLVADTWRNEIQFGHAVRPMHENTSWDRARFEVCAHKWADISEGDYGVALLNDCKYGHDCLDDMISLTLLRSSTAPDAEADQGEHEFTYALLPHMGTFQVDTAVREAYALNVPLRALKLGITEGNEGATSFCGVSNPNVIVESIKKAESDDAIILRLYEAGRTRGRVVLSFANPVKRAFSCNLLEERDEALRVKDNRVSLRVKPFEIKTVKVYFR